MNVVFFINEYEKGRFEIIDDVGRCYGIFDSSEKAIKKLNELRQRYY